MSEQKKGKIEKDFWIELSNDEVTIDILFSAEPPTADKIRVHTQDFSVIITDPAVLSQVMGIPDLFKKMVAAGEARRK